MINSSLVKLFNFIIESKLLVPRLKCVLILTLWLQNHKYLLELTVTSNFDRFSPTFVMNYTQQKLNQVLNVCGLYNKYTSNQYTGWYGELHIHRDDKDNKWTFRNR